MSDKKEEEVYGVMIAVKKITDETIKQTLELVKGGTKPYILEYGDAVPLMTSVIDERLVQAIEILEKKGIKCFQIGGVPVPPPCVPKGCGQG